MSENNEGFTTKVGSRGRVVIPDKVRNQKKIKEDDRVKLHVKKLDFEPKQEQPSEKKPRQKDRKTNFNVFG